MHHYQVFTLLSAILLSHWLQQIQCASRQDMSFEGSRGRYSNVVALAKFTQPIVTFTKFNQSIFLITSDDRVYVFGNSSSTNHPLLGLGHAVTDVTQPTEIVELSGKKIIKLCTGYAHMLALSAKGEIWSWGHNIGGQLGVGTTVNYYRPVLVEDNNVVVDIQCGTYSSYALTEKNEALAWGCNSWGQLGIGTAVDQVRPVKVNLVNVISISPTSNAQLVVGLTASGEVYRWGEGGSLSPALVALNEKIVQTVASADYCFMLTESGRIYYIHSGPSVVYVPSAYRFRSIYPDRSMDGNNDILFAQTNEGTIYFSRMTDKVFSFKKMSVTRLADSFAFLSGGVWFPYMIRLEDDTSQTTSTYTKKYSHTKPISRSEMESNIEHKWEVIERMFNNPAISDFEFHISNHTIYTNRNILAFTSNYMEKQFSSVWKTLNSVVIDDYSYRVYYLYLYYLYTDKLNPTYDEALELHTLATDLHEDKIKHRCYEILLNKVKLFFC